MSAGLLKIIAGLGFGGLLGAAVFALAHLFFLRGGANSVPYNEFVIAGAFLGAGLAHVIAKVSTVVFLPVARMATHYKKLIELHIHKQAGILSQRTAAYIHEELKKNYFLPERRDEPPKRAGFK